MNSGPGERNIKGINLYASKSKKKIARVEPLATRRRVHADTKQASRLHVPEHSISIRASRRRQSSATAKRHSDHIALAVKQAQRHAEPLAACYRSAAMKGNGKATAMTQDETQQRV